MNMLCGFVNEKKETLFSEVVSEFEDNFVDIYNSNIRHKEIFTNRIMGLVSYYGFLYADKEIKNLFPTLLPTIIENLKMSPLQSGEYQLLRKIEIDEVGSKNFNFNKSGILQKWRTNSLSTSYRVRTRMISNFVIPSYALGVSKGKKIKEKLYDKILPEDLTKNLYTYSPKMKKLLENLNKYPKQLGIIYSAFVSGEGIYLISKTLDLHGYENFSLNNKSKTKKNNEEKQESSIDNRLKKYAIISGDVNQIERQNIIDTFRHSNNKYGENIALLLISGAAAEGIDLSNVRHVHIFEPFWNYSRILQIIARAVRLNSHIELPEKERTVQPYVYLAILNDDLKGAKIINGETQSTDENLWYQSMKSDKLITMFCRALMESAIDCLIHNQIEKKIECKICSPTNEPLYKQVATSTSFQINPCKQISEEEITVNELIIESTGEKIYYEKTKNNIYNIFVHDVGTDSFLSISPSNSLYCVLKKHIIDAENRIKKVGGYDLSKFQL
jgi:hypothetical protein